MQFVYKHINQEIIILVGSIERTAAIVFAGNLAWVTTSEGLREFVAAANISEFIDCEVKRHEDTKRSKGWGYKFFADIITIIIIELL